MFSSLVFLMAPFPTKSIGRKLTLIDTFNASSHHHPTQKSIVLKTLITRAIHISSPQFLAKEKAHLTKTLLSNGYSLSQINQAFHSTNKPKPKIKNPLPPPLLVLSSLFLISKAPPIISQNSWLRRISKPCSNPTKPSNNFLELLKINLTRCLAQEFTKFLAPVGNLT
jgi:hypothetical protein